MATKNLTTIYDAQYVQGEYEGPVWYQKIKSKIKDREQVVADLIPEYTDKFLDLGCGEGNLLNYVKQKSKVLYGIDLLPRRIELAKKRYKKEVKEKKFVFSVHDLDKKLPFQKNTFDAVTCIGVVEYTLDPEFVLKEALRVLKPNGVFILEVPNLAYILERIRLFKGDLIGIAQAPGWQGGRMHHFTFSTLSRFLEQMGFDVVQKKGSGFAYQLRSLWPTLLSPNIILVARKKE